VENNAIGGRLCRYFFVMGDERTSESVAALKALCMLFYSLGKSSYGMLSKILVMIGRLFIVGFAKRVKHRRISCK
jgi:hypothetical protein